MRRITISLIVFLIVSISVFCGRKKEKTTVFKAEETSKPTYVLPDEITLEFTAERGGAGEIVIVGSTNLPDGTKIGAQLLSTDNKVQGQDFEIYISGGRFRSAGFSNNYNPWAAGNHNVNVFTYFNEVWQSPEILKITGKGGANVKGNVIKLEDPELIDSDKIMELTRIVQFPPYVVPNESKAITLVKHAILVVDGSKSATDIEENIALFMKSPGLQPSAGWSAKNDSGTKYTVIYNFINGKIGEDKAIWEVDLKTKKVRYVNKNAKYFSWTPNY